MMKTVCVLLLLAGASAGCQTNPATGKSNFNIVKEPDEIALGVSSQPEFISQYGGEIPSPEIQKYVSDMGHRLCAVGERPKLPWEFHAVDSPEINAFALPGGKVFITRGLLAKLTSEAQLAGVLGHETGHVNAMHISQQMTQAKGLGALVAGIGMAGDATDNDYLKVLGVGAQYGGQGYLLKFSRDQESQADELGVRYMSKLGYDPNAQVEVMQILKREAGGSSGGFLTEMMQTHPLPDTRIERLKTLIKERYPKYAGKKADKSTEAAYQASVLAPLAKLPPPPTPAPKQAPAK